jgi:NAD(P)-dependent dehydrogenase (short-subunit alcohol dehydrogenase family)
MILVLSDGGNSGKEYTKSIDGMEEHFATNHLAPFLFTNLIMDLVVAAGPGARIVNVSSRGHKMSDIRYDDPNWEVSFRCSCSLRIANKNLRF